MTEIKDPPPDTEEDTDVKEPETDEPEKETGDAGPGDE